MPSLMLVVTIYNANAAAVVAYNKQEKKTKTSLVFLEVQLLYSSKEYRPKEKSWSSK